MKYQQSAVGGGAVAGAVSVAVDGAVRGAVGRRASGAIGGAVGGRSRQAVGGALGCNKKGGNCDQRLDNRLAINTRATQPTSRQLIYDQQRLHSKLVISFPITDLWSVCV